MTVALDTNAYSDYLRGVAPRVAVVRSAERIHLPLIVLGELRAGFAAGSREAENLATLGQFLASSRVTVLTPTRRRLSTMLAFSSSSAKKARPSRRMTCGSQHSPSSMTSTFARRTRISASWTGCGCAERSEDPTDFLQPRRAYGMFAMR